MTTTLLLKVTEDGLRLPRQLFRQTGEVEVVEQNDYILIKPKSGEDTRTRAIASLLEAQTLAISNELKQMPRDQLVALARSAKGSLQASEENAAEIVRRLRDEWDKDPHFQRVLNANEIVGEVYS